MTPLFVELRDNRIQAASAFAKQFNQFEWKYLCSCQWFLTGTDRALDTGDFFPMRIRADEALVEAKLRRQVSTVTPDASSHDNAQWFQCFGI
jgi:hypothetical protein